MKKPRFWSSKLTKRENKEVDRMMEVSFKNGIKIGQQQAQRRRRRR